MATARGGHATYYMDITLLSQNRAGNYSTINVHIYAVSDSAGWSGYASNVGFSASYYGNGNFSFNGTRAEIVSYNVNLQHDSRGYCNYAIAAHTNATGTQSFGGPVDWSTSGSLPRIPKLPGAPAVSVAQPVGRNVTVTASVPAGYDDGGSTISTIVWQYSKDGGAWTGTTYGAWGARTYSNLLPGSYVFRAYAVNSVGNSAAVQTGAVKVGIGGRRWTGSAEVLFTSAMRWDGTKEVPLTVAMRWDGTKEVPITS